jgi:hypothetical protein
MSREERLSPTDAADARSMSSRARTSTSGFTRVEVNLSVAILATAAPIVSAATRHATHLGELLLTDEVRRRHELAPFSEARNLRVLGLSSLTG